MNKRFYQVFAIVMALIFSFSIVSADSCPSTCPAIGSGKAGVDAYSAGCASCTDCANPATTCNDEFSFELTGVTTSNGDVTYSYEVCKLGVGPAVKDLSHWSIGLGQITCLGEGFDLKSLVKSCTIGGVPALSCKLGLDPTTQLYGLKFEPVNVSDNNNCQAFSITFDTTKLADNYFLDTGCTTAATKAGNQDITRNDRPTPGYACIQGPVCKQEIVPPQSVLNVNKFYDANADGNWDLTEELITGWQISINELCTYTPYTAEVEPKDYTVSEYLPTQTNWMPTTPTSFEFTIAAGETKGVMFGNLCLGAGGGKTLGFWSNRNGEAKMKDGSGEGPELAMLTKDLNLREANGTDFNPDDYKKFRSWLLSANATNMAYMLSAQLAAMALNVEAKFVSDSALVYAPGCGNTGINNNFITIQDLMGAADASLKDYNKTLSGHTQRANQECLKNALDWANNNKNFVQPEPCPFSFNPTCSE